jgi:hypothetical protein
VFTSIYGSGTIDYRSGECFLTTKFDYAQVDSMEPVLQPGQPDPTEGRTHFVHVLSGGTSITPGSVWLIFTVGQDADQRTFVVNDVADSDGSGGFFTHSSIKEGTINYDSKRIEIIFNSPLVDPSIRPFNCRYCFPIDYVLPEGTVLLATYFFTHQSIFISEAGFRNKDGILLNYATFPPFEFNSNAYHLSFMVMVRKSEETANPDEPEEPDP